MKKLTDYLEPKKNVPYECHVIRRTAQNLGETMDKYLTILLANGTNNHLLSLRTKVQVVLLESPSQRKCLFHKSH